jgi:hypothetical protein
MSKLFSHITCFHDDNISMMTGGNPLQVMKLLVELVKWLGNNLSQRTRRLPTHSWTPDLSGHCREGEQVSFIRFSTLHPGFTVWALFPAIATM